MEDSKRLEAGESTGVSVSFWAGATRWGLLAAGTVLVIGGVAANWSGLRLEVAGQLGRLHVQREKGFIEPFKKVVGADVVRPFERVVGLSSKDMLAGDEGLVRGVGNLKTLSLEQSSNQPPLDLSAVGWLDLGKLDRLSLTSDPLDLTAIDWSAQTALRELRLTSSEFRVRPGMRFPATLTKVSIKGHLHPDLLAALANSPKLQSVMLTVPVDLPQPFHWGDGLRAVRTQKLVVLASPMFSTIPTEHVDWEGLGRLRGVDELQLIVSSVGPDALQKLSKAKGLRQLTLNFDAWQPGANAPLNGFDSLEALNLMQCLRAPPEHGQYPGESLVLHSNLPALRSLTLMTPYASLRKEHLPLLQGIQLLHVASPLDPGVCESLAQWPGLERLSLTGADLTLENLTPLSRSRSLRHLSIPGTRAAMVLTEDWRQEHLPGVEIITKPPELP